MEIRIRKNRIGVRAGDAGSWTTHESLQLNDILSDLEGILNGFSEDNKSRKSKMHKNFVTLLTHNGFDLEEAAIEVEALLNRQFRTEEDVEEVPVANEHIEFVNTPSPSFTPKFVEECVAAVVLAAQYERGNINAKPSLWIIGPSGTGKSESMELANSIDLMNWIGRSTENAWAPGIPNAEIERHPGILERSHHRCICVNECANFETDKAADKALGLLADLTTMGHTTISDPAGDYSIDADVTGIFGMTPAKYYAMLKKSTGIGQRYLMLKTENDRKNHSAFRRIISNKDKKIQMVNWIRTAALLPLKEPTDEMIDYAFDYATMTMDARSISSSKTKKSTVGASRLADQLIYMALMHANLHQHDPTIDDVEYFLRLLAPMIGWQEVFDELLKHFGAGNSPRDSDHFENAHAGYKETLFKNYHFGPLGIVEMCSDRDVKINDDWFDFLTEMQEWW